MNCPLRSMIRWSPRRFQKPVRVLRWLTGGTTGIEADDDDTEVEDVGYEDDAEAEAETEAVG